MPIEFAKLSSHQLDELPRQKTVFFFPIGPLEDHGPHLPLGLDLEEASRLCYLSAQHLETKMTSWTGVVMPPAPLGIDSNTTRIAITVRPHVVRDWLVDSCRCLMKADFIHFVCFTGHLGPKQLTAIEDAGKMIRKFGRWKRWGQRLRGRGSLGPNLISASSVLVSKKEVLDSPFWPDPSEHGGRRDTSVALAIGKDTVDPNFKKLPAILRVPNRWLRNFNRRRGVLAGYWGAPAEAKASQGEEELELLLDRVFLKMRAVWGGANPNFSFRSWYSILPPNKSFFKAWLLLFLICLLMAAWAFLTSLTFPQFNS